MISSPASVSRDNDKNRVRGRLVGKVVYEDPVEAQQPVTISVQLEHRKISKKNFPAEKYLCLIMVLSSDD